MNQEPTLSCAKHAFVLAGGGSLGAVQAGMLAELIAAGRTPDLIVGVSAGAINGAFLAHDPSLPAMDRLTALWGRVRTRDILPVSMGSLLALIGRRGYLAESHGVRRLLERELPFRQFSAARIPLYIVATEQGTGAEVILSEGNVIEAILASSAIPGVFPPVVLGGRTLVDGVVAAGTPISAAVALGSTHLTIIPCGFTCVQSAVPRHAMGLAMHAITLLGARQLRADFSRHAERAQLCVVPPLCPLGYSAYDYSHGTALVAAARLSTRKWIDDGGLDTRTFPDQLVAHHH